MVDLAQAMESAHAILAEAKAEFNPVATISLFSGGHDSTVVTHLFRKEIDYIFHINTGIGIPQTNEFVRRASRDMGVELIEAVTPPEVYEDFLRRGNIGFPGPSGHQAIYWYLKQQRLRELRRRFINNPRKERVLYVTGIRTAESSRRMQRKMSVPIRREGSIVWVSPILEWDGRLMNRYFDAHPDCPRNEVSDLLHRSGECLCGAFAKSAELDEIAVFYPEVAQRIRRLECELEEAGAKNVKWGGQSRRSQVVPGPLCSGCVSDEGDDDSDQ